MPEHRTKPAERLMAQFNDLVPVGSRVLYWPGPREGEGRASVTRSEAWLLGGHTPVVLVDDYAGGIALSHVCPLPGLPTTLVDGAVPSGANDAVPSGADGAVPLEMYSAALDEVHRLRQAAAYEAQVTAAHLSYKTFPKSRRQNAERQIERLRDAARGRSQVAYANVSYLNLRHAMREAGAAETLTRTQFETELPKRHQ